MTRMNEILDLADPGPGIKSHICSHNRPIDEYLVCAAAAAAAAAKAARLGGDLAGASQPPPICKLC